jgi:DNA-binding transcriptional ArsR family regulator
MVEYRTATLDATFGALSDPSRRAILDVLRTGEQRVTEIAAPFAMSLNAVSKHLKTLERAGLVARDVRGREHYFTLVAAPLDGASRWIAAYRDFWEPRLDALAEFLDEQATGGAGRGSPEDQEGSS